MEHTKIPHNWVDSCSYIQLLDQAETATVSDEEKSFNNICIGKKKNVLGEGEPKFEMAQ